MSLRTKPCIWGCGQKLYWNTTTSQYFEEGTNQRHICPNRNQNLVKPSNVITKTSSSSSYSPSAYKRKETIPKEPVSNSFEYLYGYPKTVREQYNYLSDLITKAGGKVHGSQSHVIDNGMLKILIYYEVPIGKREDLHIKYSE